MFGQPMTVERLLAHSIIFDEAARLHNNERVARELRSSLDTACRPRSQWPAM
jgi:hypothetical protein